MCLPSLAALFLCIFSRVPCWQPTTLCPVCKFVWRTISNCTGEILLFFTQNHALRVNYTKYTNQDPTCAYFNWLTNMLAISCSPHQPTTVPTLPAPAEVYSPRYYPALPAPSSSCTYITEPLSHQQHPPLSYPLSQPPINQQQVCVCVCMCVCVCVCAYHIAGKFDGDLNFVLFWWLGLKPFFLLGTCNDIMHAVVLLPPPGTSLRIARLSLGCCQLYFSLICKLTALLPQVRRWQGSLINACSRCL